MQETCYRCGGELASGSKDAQFCPHCGAPQLFFQEYDRTDTLEENTTGAPPPPPVQQIDWQTAIRCAALVAGAAALITLVATRVPVLSPLGTLTVISASIITLGLYQRRRPNARMSASIGARIGLVVGLCLILSLAIALATAGVISRFGLHSMGPFDAELTKQLHTQVERAAAANPTAPEILRYFYTPEFRAGLLLTGYGMLTAFLLLFSTVGGALSGLFRTQRQPVA